MIIKLSLETINSRSPYFVDMVSDKGPFAFTSDSGVELAVDFVDDDLITTTESYQLVVSNVNNRQSPRDKKVQETLFAIVEEFFGLTCLNIQKNILHCQLLSLMRTE